MCFVLVSTQLIIIYSDKKNVLKLLEKQSEKDIFLEIIKAIFKLFLIDFQGIFKYFGNINFYINLDKFSSCIKIFKDSSDKYYQINRKA